MIGKLKGIVDSTGTDWVILDVGGVGYVVSCSTRTLQTLPSAGEATQLAIETYVREDQIRLFGFSSDLEREWFRILLNVQGVGTRVALAILSTLKPSELAQAIALKDKAAIGRTSGVGPKLAERICVELKDKSPAFLDIDPIAMRLSRDAADKNNSTGVVGDAVSALINLGYAQAQAAQAVATCYARVGEGAKVQELIRLGLKELSNI
jgi:holliday junction DNA helicase RuvA